MRSDDAQAVAVPAIDIAKLGIADADGLLQHGSQTPAQDRRGAADDLKHLRRGRLLL